jgi:hypothetical protein
MESVCHGGNVMGGNAREYVTMGSIGEQGGGGSGGGGGLKVSVSIYHKNTGREKVFFP